MVADGDELLRAALKPSQRVVQQGAVGLVAAAVGYVAQLVVDEGSRLLRAALDLGGIMRLGELGG